MKGMTQDTWREREREVRLNAEQWTHLIIEVGRRKNPGFEVQVSKVPRTNLWNGNPLDSRPQNKHAYDYENRSIVRLVWEEGWLYEIYLWASTKPTRRALRVQSLLRTNSGSMPKTCRYAGWCFQHQASEYLTRSSEAYETPRIHSRSWRQIAQILKKKNMKRLSPAPREGRTIQLESEEQMLTSEFKWFSGWTVIGHSKRNQSGDSD